MNPKDFEEAIIQERFTFLTLCERADVTGRVEIISPRLAPAFAEGLILCLTEAEARAQIERDPAGAMAVVEVAGNLLAHRKTRVLLAATMPCGARTPFYLLSALVLDAAHEARHAGELPTD